MALLRSQPPVVRVGRGTEVKEFIAMLRNVSKLEGATIHATDGEIGKVVEPLFDDDNWTVRYLVVNTGNWLLRHKVLISPISVRSLDWETVDVKVDLTKDQVKDSPDVDADRPVSRQWETENSNYYGWPAYWGGIGFAGAGGSGPGLWGGGFYPGALAGIPSLAETVVLDPQTPEPDRHEDTHLRSAKEVVGYAIGACDNELGKIDDFIFDDETWAIRYLVVDTQNWWPGKKILLPPRWATGVNWADRTVTTDLNISAVRGAPEWNSEYGITREFEERLHAYYGRTGYWQNERLDKRDC